MARSLGKGAGWIDYLWGRGSDGAVQAAPSWLNRAYIQPVWIPVYLANYREGVLALKGFCLRSGFWRKEEPFLDGMS